MKKFPDDGSFLDHLEELRQRILLVLLWFAIASCISYAFKNQILRIVLEPLVKSQEKIVFISLVEPFFSIIKISLLTGFLLSFPFLVYQTYVFVKPALESKQSKIITWFIISSQFLFYGGAAFAFFLIVPAGLRILFSFGAGMMHPMITVSHYLSFLIWMVLGLSIVFQVPVIMAFLVVSNIMSIETLIKTRKLVIVGSFIVAAIITPTTDIITQTIIAGVLIILYEITVIILRVTYKRKSLKELNLD